MNNFVDMSAFSPLVDVIIPAFNEEKSVGLVINEIPQGIAREVVVCNNASTDRTAESARMAGATVVNQPLKGYGNACLAGIEYLRGKTLAPEVVVFMDADHSDYPGEIQDILDPFGRDDIAMVVGSRTLGERQRGSITIQQRFGNWLATSLIRMIYGYRFTDLGPFRAIRWDTLMQMDMEDKNFGWTVEMQVKAAKMGIGCTEVPVNYRKRIGKSKVSGTIRGTVMAGYKILWTIFKLV